MSKPKSPLDEPYLPGDRIPTPEAQERNTETVWEAFKELEARHDQRFADTVPFGAGQQPARTDPGFDLTVPAPLDFLQPAKPAAAKPVGVAELMAEARKHGRVCPLPSAWQALYQLIPDKRQQGTAWQPPPPITGPAWTATPASAKRMCLAEQLHWAASHGAAAPVLGFLQDLVEDEWLHG
jgi:hypothetical protein